MMEHVIPISTKPFWVTLYCLRRSKLNDSIQDSLRLLFLLPKLAGGLPRGTGGTSRDIHKWRPHCEGEGGNPKLLISCVIKTLTWGRGKKSQKISSVIYGCFPSTSKDSQWKTVKWDRGSSSLETHILRDSPTRGETSGWGPSQTMCDHVPG